MEARQTASARSGKWTITRLSAEQRQALDREALSLSARLGVRIHRYNVIQGVVETLLKIKSGDAKSELVANEFKGMK